MLHNNREDVAKLLKSVAQAIHPNGGKFISVTQLDPRKKHDLAFLRDFIISNLSNQDNARLCSIKAHVTDSNDSKLPVPTVIVYEFCKYKPSVGDVIFEIIEYHDE